VRDWQAIRKKVAAQPELAQGWLNSLKPSITKLAERFELASWTGESLQQFDAATDDEVKAMWEQVLKIDGSLEIGKLTKAGLAGKQPLQEFLKCHTLLRKYPMHIFKVVDCVCAFCASGIIKPIRMPADEFARVHVLPDPQPRTRQGEDLHYKTFEELYGTETTEKYRPSLLADESDPFFVESGFFKTGNNARFSVCCLGCGKPRIVFAPSRVKREDKETVVDFAERTHYTCGARILPENHGVSAALTH
jgi:hypothetical protein